MDDGLKENLTARETWLRGLFILLFAFLLTVARFVVWSVVVVQFLFKLLSGRPNKNLRDFGNSLSRYIYQSHLFVTFNSEIKPFPFSDWPAATIVDEAALADTDTPAASVKKRVSKKKAVKKKAPAKKAAAKSGTATSAGTAPPPDNSPPIEGTAPEPGAGQANAESADTKSPDKPATGGPDEGKPVG